MFDAAQRTCVAVGCSGGGWDSAASPGSRMSPSFVIDLNLKLSMASAASCWFSFYWRWLWTMASLALDDVWTRNFFLEVFRWLE